MHQIRQFKFDLETYNKIYKEIQQKWKRAKEQWVEENCEEIKRFKHKRNV